MSASSSAHDSSHPNRLEVQPLPGPHGAVVRGVDLSRPLAPASRDAIWAAFLQWHVVWFPDQQLGPVQQAEFAQQFGELDTYPFVTPMAEHDKVIPIIKEATTKINFGGAWHTDTSYLPMPPKATLLYAVEVPARGGDTLFADTSAAFEALSSGMQDLLAPLVGVFTADLVHGKAGAYAQGADHPMDYGDRLGVAERRVEHPIIRTHPETGRRAIYATPVHCSHLVGMTREDSRVLLDFIYKQATRPEFVTRLPWTAGSLAMWDNRCTFHYALNDYAGQRREMRRVILKGDEPA